MEKIFLFSPVSIKPSELIHPLSSSINTEKQTSTRTPELRHQNKSVTWKQNTSNFLIFKEISRIEEEFDLKALKTNTYSYKNYKTEAEKLEEIELTARFLQELVSCLEIFDKKIGNVLSKAWKLYQKALNRSVKKKIDEIELKTEEKVRIKDAAVQVTEDLGEVDQEEYLKYITMLNKALSRIDKMNHKRLVKKLGKVLEALMEKDDLFSFEPEDIAENAKSAEVNPLIDAQVIEEVLNVSEAPRKRLRSTVSMAKSCQTDINSASSPSSESLMAMLNERDKIIYQLREAMSLSKKTEEKLAKSLKSAEANLSSKKQILKELQKNKCGNCTDKEQRLKEEKQHVEELKKNAHRTEEVEIELEGAKEMLRESAVIIGKGNEKIIELSDELRELNDRIGEIQLERRRLEEKLQEEETIRSSLEAKFQATNNLNERNRKQIYFMDYKNSKTKKEIFQNERKTIGLLESVKKIDDLDQNPRNETNESEKASRKVSFERSKESFNRTVSLEQRRSSLKRDKLGDLSLVKENGISRSSFLKKSKIIHSILKISKEEFLSYSKQTRIELFECLYEHKDKCGPMCEHLRRAEMIKQKERGKLYPMKNAVLVL